MKLELRSIVDVFVVAVVVVVGGGGGGAVVVVATDVAVVVVAAAAVVVVPLTRLCATFQKLQPTRHIMEVRLLTTFPFFGLGSNVIKKYFSVEAR